MKSKPTGRSLTFGDLVENFYDAYGNDRARGMVRLAVKTRHVEFRGRQRYALGREMGRHETQGINSQRV